MLVSVAGMIAVNMYAVLMWIVIQVLNPLSMAPGLTLEQIRAAADAAGEPVFTPFPAMFSAVGVALGVLVFVLTLRFPRFTTGWVAVSYLILLALGLPTYVVASFGPGMSLGDTFSLGGSDSEVWLVLGWTSAVAFCLAAGISAGLLARVGLNGAGRLARRTRRTV